NRAFHSGGPCRRNCRTDRAGRRFCHPQLLRFRVTARRVGAGPGIAERSESKSFRPRRAMTLALLLADPPKLEEVAKAVADNTTAINFVWTLVAGFLVMFMQAGFAMVETGFTRAKNASHTMAMNFMVYAIGMLGYWVCGYAFQMGGVGAVSTRGGTPGLTNEFTTTVFGKPFGLIGLNGFFLSKTYDVGVFALFLFQMVFMDTAATIPTGAMAERWKFSAFVIFGFFMAMFVYPIFANWVWGGGWLSQL